jgi:sRNA-binding protein
MTDPERTLAKLIERWPLCFSADAPRPLAIGVFHDLRRAAPEIDADELSDALAAYTQTDAYLTELTRKKARRVSLSGEPVAHVGKEDAERARRMLGERRLERRAR